MTRDGDGAGLQAWAAGGVQQPLIQRRPRPRQRHLHQTEAAQRPEGGLGLGGEGGANHLHDGVAVQADADQINHDQPAPGLKPQQASRVRQSGAVRRLAALAGIAARRGGMVDIDGDQGAGALNHQVKTAGEIDDGGGQGVLLGLEGGADREDLLGLLQPGAGRNAIDCALWDLEAKRSGRAVATMIDGPDLTSMPNALTVVIDTPAAMARAAALIAAAPAVSPDLAKVRAHLAAVQSMTATFAQTDRYGKTLNGTLSLKRPGKIRFQYEKGVPILIVAEGGALTFIDYSVRQVQRWPIKNSPLGALLDPNGGQRWVVYDEAWRLMSHPALLRRMDAHWRLARHYGIANMLIFHKLTDLDNVGDQGSAMRSLANSLLANAETRIVYRQEPDQLGSTTLALGLTGTEQKLLPGLGTGQGLWRIKDRSFVVQHQLHPAELAAFDTTGRMTSDSHEFRNLDVPSGIPNDRQDS